MTPRYRASSASRRSPRPQGRGPSSLLPKPLAGAAWPHAGTRGDDRDGAPRRPRRRGASHRAARRPGPERLQHPAVGVAAPARRHGPVRRPPAPPAGRGPVGSRAACISCGAALHHAQVAARALGWEPTVRRLPDPSAPALLAEVRLAPALPPRSAAADIRAMRRAQHRPAPLHVLAGARRAARATRRRGPRVGHRRRGRHRRHRPFPDRPAGRTGPPAAGPRSRRARRAAAVARPAPG